MSLKIVPRLIIVTGKGGVGKTTCALALTKYLQNKNINAVYLTHQMGTLRREENYPDYEIIKNFCQKLSIPQQNLVLKTCLTEYVAKKLGSSLIADWVVKTKFFSALVEIIPGFSQLIYMGRILQDLKNDPKLHYILDAAATGHALTLIESVYNFQKIFSIGPLHHDTEMLKKLFTSKDFVKVVLVSIPQELSITEFNELNDNLQEIDSSISCTMNLNQFFSISEFPWDEISKTQYWSNKLEMEKKLEKSFDKNFIKIPLIPQFDILELVTTLAQNVDWERSIT